VLVLLSARLLHEGPVAHSHQAHLQTIEMDWFFDYLKMQFQL
jgi:hypothetical protein